MAHEDALIELAGAVARLSDSVTATAQLLQILCEKIDAEAQRPAAPSLVAPSLVAPSLVAPSLVAPSLVCAPPRSTAFQLIQGGRSTAQSMPTASARE